MISVSTAWNATSSDSGKKIAEQILSLGIKNIELGFSINEQMLEQILELKKQNIIAISSVHNYCPVLPGYKPGTFTPDFFSLSSPDELQRQKAVSLTKRSIDTVVKVGAKHLIVHAGRVEMAQRTKELIGLFNSGKRDTEEYSDLLSQIKKERDQKKQPFIDAIVKSLDEIIQYAGLEGVNICVENRFYHREIPSFDELGLFFKLFNGKNNFFYWYDLGHAQVGQNLGFVKNIEYLESFKDKIAGMHMHDVSGTHDHQVPGLGDFDFSLLKPYLKKTTIKVLEIHQPATAEQIKTSIAHLKNAGILDHREYDVL